MAKIKQVKMRLGLNPDREWKETVVNICYDSTDKRTENYRRPIPEQRFYIKLPQVVADALGIPDVRGSNQVEVMENFEETLKKFKNLNTEVNKVILYAFEVEPKPKEKGNFFTGHYRVVLWAGTFQETVAISGDGVRRYSYERIESDVNFATEQGARYAGKGRLDGKRYKCQVPWTDKNEVFFLWLKSRTEELIARLYELVEPDKMIETISAGYLMGYIDMTVLNRSLPLGNQPDKESVR